LYKINNMRHYKIIKNKTNTGRLFYTIKFKTKFLFINYWTDYTYENSNKPVEYEEIEHAKRQIEIFIDNRKCLEEIVIEKEEIL
jgi:hypothetical protein